MAECVRGNLSRLTYYCGLASDDEASGPISQETSAKRVISGRRFNYLSAKNRNKNKTSSYPVD